MTFLQELDEYTNLDDFVGPGPCRGLGRTYKGPLRTPDGRLFAKDPRSIEERFWSKVNKNGKLILGAPCWEWTDAPMNKGYGVFGYDNSRKKALAHRFSWELQNGPITNGLHCLHKCDNPPCINPDHLFLGTPADNAKDKVKKGRQSHAVIFQGEEYPHSKLTTKDVLEIREKYPDVSQRALGRIYGVSQHMIWQIINRRRWKHV